jgi:nitronate monooxygenase
MPYSPNRSLPILIQGGMGAGVSSWRLARTVSRTGQMGVVSGTAIDVIVARRLQLGDDGGHMRRALAAFPYPGMAERIVERYYIPGGKDPATPFLNTQVLPIEPTQEELELTVVANFVEVYLAKEGHGGLVGVNYLEKIQTPTLPSLYGAMLADVDFVLMGAGIPRSIPGVLDRLHQGESVELPYNVIDAGGDDHFTLRFCPKTFVGGELLPVRRPNFLPIVASATLASMLARKANGRVDGFIIEGPTAGGHNAPPRGPSRLNERGEPIYGERDVVDLEAFRALGLPFWLAGSYGSPEQVVEALAAGAAGVQVGTAFAFSEESGLERSVKDRVFQMCRDGQLDVVTDAAASPTGFPFKVLQLEGSMSDKTAYDQRRRVCDLGFLRQGYRKSDGTVGLRCPSEPIAPYLRKGGDEADVTGRKCVCNGLLANIGMGQSRRNGQDELPLITCGDDVRSIRKFLKTDDATSYSAVDVVKRLLSLVEAGGAMAVECGASAKSV